MLWHIDDLLDRSYILFAQLLNRMSGSMGKKDNRLPLHYQLKLDTCQQDISLGAMLHLNTNAQLGNLYNFLDLRTCKYQGCKGF